VPAPCGAWEATRVQRRFSPFQHSAQHEKGMIEIN